MSKPIVPICKLCLKRQYCLLKERTDTMTECDYYKRDNREIQAIHDGARER